MLKTFMKIVIIIFFITVIFLGCSSAGVKNIECENFKNGKFILRAELNNTDYLLERKDSIQVETNLKDGKITKWKVVWTNQCTYELWYLAIAPLNKQDSFFTTHPFVNKILKTTKDFYVFESRMEANNYRMVDTIFVMK
jgi:hypothetical protein